MVPIGINYVGLFVIFALLASDAIALYWLSRGNIPPTARAIWALVILLFPALGVIAFVITTRSGNHPTT